MNSTQTLERLEAEHKALYEAFLPTLSQYQDMARKALELQIGIFAGRLGQDLEVEIKHRSLVTKISARETPAHLARLLGELTKAGIKVTEVIYDARTFDFYLYAD
jgi:hypothetical protein